MFCQPVEQHTCRNDGQVVTKLQFNAATSRFIFGYPEVHFKKIYRFTKGDFMNLAWS